MHRPDHAAVAPQHQPLSARRVGLIIRLWLGLSAALPFLLHLVARRLHRRQGAAADRFRERLGQASHPRPAGHLVWIHAASVGEMASVARLARQLSQNGPLALLITTVTATGAATAARLVPGALHQFLPVDTPAAVNRFLDHWRPDTAIFVEGDLWPRMILSLEARACPMILLNARASRTRDRFPAASVRLLSPMRLITVQDGALVDGLVGLGLDPDRICAPGNLKADIDKPQVDAAARDQLFRAAQGRGLWAAVSTHPGEDLMILDVHAGLSGQPLLILAPRHPERARDLTQELARRGLVFTRHSLSERPDATTQVHLVDALGVTGTVYAAAGLAFVGGSLVKGFGGHTPFEPVALGCAVLSGPHVRNFASAYRSLQAAEAATLVEDKAALGARLHALLGDHAARAAMQRAALSAYDAQRGATTRTIDAIARVLPDILSVKGSNSKGHARTEPTGSAASPEPPGTP